ncbi:MAG: transposase [Acidobacteria bacterium]|nr:transposase [Acidobacteriota bacterium]
MARKLRTIKGRGVYKKRKQIVEPVFGQIKEARGYRRFLLRGLNPSLTWIDIKKPPKPMILMKIGGFRQNRACI